MSERLAQPGGFEGFGERGPNKRHRLAHRSGSGRFKSWPLPRAPLELVWISLRSLPALRSSLRLGRARAQVR